VDLVKSIPHNISCIETFVAVYGEESWEIGFADFERVFGLGKKGETWIRQARECRYPEVVYKTGFISAG